MNFLRISTIYEICIFPCVLISAHWNFNTAKYFFWKPFQNYLVLFVDANQREIYAKKEEEFFSCVWISYPRSEYLNIVTKQYYVNCIFIYFILYFDDQLYELVVKYFKTIWINKNVVLTQIHWLKFII